MSRRNLELSELNPTKFDVLVRYMIVAAEKKRFVEYNELNKVFGISLEDLRDYAGFLGDYCAYANIPPLNSLIVNTTDGKPGEDYYTWYSQAYGTSTKTAYEAWGESVAGCFVEFKVPISNSVRFINTSGISKDIMTFLSGKVSS